MMKKQNSTFSFLALMTAFVFVAGFSTSSSAQDRILAQEQSGVSHVDNVLEDLNAKEVQAQAQIQPLQATSELLKSEQEKLRTLLKQNETQLAALKETSVTLTLKAFEELVLNNSQNPCQIAQSQTNPYEFTVTKGDVKIRFVLAGENSTKKPTVRKFIVPDLNVRFAMVSGYNVIRYEQTGWSDKNSSGETFRAIIDTNIKSSEKEKEQIVRMTFNGETIDTRNFFQKFASSEPPAETPITCILSN